MILGKSILTNLDSIKISHMFLIFIKPGMLSSIILILQ